MKRSKAERAAILKHRCAECGAKPSMPCVCLRRGRYRKLGDPVKDFHIKRVLRAKPKPQLDEGER